MANTPWINPDGLRLNFGPAKATPGTAGDFRSPGQYRMCEVDIDISTLTTTAAIQDYNTILGAGMFIDRVEVIATTPALTITSLSVGLMKQDYTTAISDTALVSALVLASIDGQGETTSLTFGVTSAGTKVGTTVGTDPGYISAKIAGSAGTGIVKVRIFYHGTGTITQ